MRDLHDPNAWRRAYQDLKTLGRDYGAILVALTPFDIAYDLASLIAGQDLLSGHRLTTFETVAILVGFFTAGLGDDILGGGGRLLRSLDDADDVAARAGRGFSHLDEATALRLSRLDDFTAGDRALLRGDELRRALVGFDESGDELHRRIDAVTTLETRQAHAAEAWARAGFDLDASDVRWMIERGRGPVIGGSGGSRPIWDPFARRWRDPRTGQFARRPHDMSEALRAASRLVEGGLSSDEVSGLLNTIAVASTRGDLTEGGVVSLGHFYALGDAPGYIDWVKDNRTATFFDMDPDVYATVQGKKIEEKSIPWLVNERFLDMAAEAGVIFHLQARKPRRWSTGFGREIRYLEGTQGYERVKDNGEWWMKPKTSTLK